MDTARLPAKSILKQAPTKPKPTLSDEQKAQAERNRRNLGLALHHANKIQNRKDVEAQILKNIEILADFPAGTLPTSKEAANFTQKVSLFQPSDLAALVEERNADGRCGHVLCSKCPRNVTLGANGLWKLKGEGAADYCSNECLKRALYVRTQLSEVPAWERESGEEVRVELYGSETSRTDTRLSKNVAASNDRELASERDERPGSFRAGQVIADSIVEKTNVSRKAQSSSFDDGSAFDEIEGYVPMQGSGLNMQTSMADRASASDETREAVQKMEKPPFNDASNAESVVQKSDAGVEPTLEEEEEAWNIVFGNLPTK